MQKPASVLCAVLLLRHIHQIQHGGSMGEGRSHLFDPMEIAEDGDRRALSPPRVRVGRGSASRLASACLPPHVRRHMLTPDCSLPPRQQQQQRERESGEDGRR